MSTCWGRCPLATYLREAHDAYDIRVGEHTYRMILPEGDTGDCPLPNRPGVECGARPVGHRVGRDVGTDGEACSRPCRGIWRCDRQWWQW
jgi:hypothetical protein